MTATTITGWLYDIYASAKGITIWLIDKEGGKHCCSVPFVPSFFMHLSHEDTKRLGDLVQRLPCRITLSQTKQREIYSNEEWPVQRVSVHDALQFKRIVRRLERNFPHYSFFNSDIAVPQLFLYSTGLFPLAYGMYHIDGNGILLEWHLEDSFDAMEYTMPPLTTMRLRNRPDFVSPKFRKTYQLELSYDGATYSLENEEPAEILHSLNRHLQRCDPDVLLTEYGDAILMPLLTRLSVQEEIPLLLNRDREMGYFTTNETSYFAYGKIVHKDGAFELAGRWHLDTENSFMMGEASLDGVAEIARLTQLSVQHQSRSTIGSALSSMQLSWAHQHNYLIPAKKREPEEFKSAATLLLADRGGLIYQPIMGYHEQIAELDFVSMYPTIMVKHNVSPETVNCRCCTNTTVPELDYTICEKRIGIVPSTLSTVVHKRSLYKKEKKRLKKLGDEDWHIYDRRQNALKWMLVTCFGYLGYKNARFGRIEAHESVNAYSRDAILCAKEIAERHGHKFIHAIVDCLWLHKEGATEEEYEKLAAEISAATGIDLSLEGIYNWIVFPSSKMDPQIPTANKYVGYYTNGDIKIRGIEVRRRDTVKLIKRMQAEMLELFQHARNVKEVEALVPAALVKAKEYIDLLRSGKADPMDLVVRCHISKEPESYTTRTVNSEAARALNEAGIQLKPGETVEYIIVDATGKRKPQKSKPLALYTLDDGYDIEKYTEFALKAVETLLLPFGWDVEKLEAEFGAGKKKKGKARYSIAKAALSLFEQSNSCTFFA